jgi:hypothetical protein
MLAVWLKLWGLTLPRHHARVGTQPNSNQTAPMQTFSLRTPKTTKTTKPPKSQKREPPITAHWKENALALTVGQWQQYISPNLEDCRGICHKVGVHDTIIGFKAPAVSICHSEGGLIESYTLYGERQLQGCFPTGHRLEGVVSIGNRKRKAYTSSVVCRLPDGTLLESAVIVVRID